MKRWQKAWTIATFEFITAVKRPGYLIATFGMPLFVAAYAGVVAIPAYFASRADVSEMKYGVVDEARILGLGGEVKSDGVRVPGDVRKMLDAAGQSKAVEEALERSRFTFLPFESEPQARASVTSRSITGYFVIPKDYLATGNVDIYTYDSISLMGSEARSAFAAVLRQRLVEGRLDADTSARIVDPLKDTREFSVTRSGEVGDGGDAASVVRIAVPTAFMVLFLMSVLMTSGYLMQGTATEKENKVVDVLLASADPQQILAGKLFGLGAAGLLQILMWLLFLFVGVMGALPLFLSSGVEMPWVALGLALPLFLLAFLFFGSLMLGTGSLGSNMREAQQLAMVWSLTAALPMMMMAALIREPHGMVSRVLTWLPFSSGPLIMFRASTDLEHLAWWEVVGALVVLMLSTWFAIRLGARLFRIGLLSSSRPKLSEIMRQARLS